MKVEENRTTKRKRKLKEGLWEKERKQGRRLKKRRIKLEKRE